MDLNGIILSLDNANDKAEDLVEYVKEKGTPVMEKTAEAIRSKAIDVTKEVLNKLESKQAK